MYHVSDVKVHHPDHYVIVRVPFVSRGVRLMQPRMLSPVDSPPTVLPIENASVIIVEPSGRRFSFDLKVRKGVISIEILTWSTLNIPHVTRRYNRLIVDRMLASMINLLGRA